MYPGEGRDAVSQRRRLAVVAAALASFGGGACATVINGTTSTIEVRTSTPGAKVYIDGFEAKESQPVQNDQAHILLVRAPGYTDHVEIIEPSVAPLPIVLDVIFAVPSFLVVPLVDVMIGQWFDVSSRDEPVALRKAAARTPRARPIYQVGDVAVQSRPGKLSTPSEPPPPEPPPAEPPPSEPETKEAPPPPGRGTPPKK